MIYLTLFIPLIFALVFFVIKRKINIQYVWLLVVLPLPFTFRECSIHDQVKQNEILGGNVLAANYYEHWNEYIHQTCTRQNCTSDSKGNQSCTTEYYDCSYVQDHPEYWELETTLGDMTTTSGQYNYLKTKFGNSSFVDMNRNYHSIDGDKYTSQWKGDSASFEPYFMNNSYVNKIQASNSIFNFGPADTVKYKLFNRLGTYDGEASSFISKGINVGKGNASLNYYNALFGKSKQLRMIVLVFENQPIQIALEQEKLWKGGNKNEFIVTMSIDKDSTIQWVKPFSWTMKKVLFPEIRDGIYNFKKFNDQQIAHYIGTTVPQKWQRREFKEFEYLRVEESEGAFYWNLATIIFLSIAWFITAMITFDHFNGASSNRYGRGYGRRW